MAGVIVLDLATRAGGAQFGIGRIHTIVILLYYIL